MSKGTDEKWVQIGYDLFASEGLEAIQVEWLARIINLNKSGFYHYFADREGFLDRLLKHHLDWGHAFANDVQHIRQIDPDLIFVLLKHRTPVLVHMQLVRNRHHQVLKECFDRVNNMVDPLVIPVFARYVGTEDYKEFAALYFEQIRDAFYSRLTFKNFNESFLRAFFAEAKEIIRKLNLRSVH